MTDRSFVDTNVWVYAVDDDEPAKQAMARAVLDPSAAASLVLSSQVLGELYVTITRKFGRRVTEDIAGAMVERLRQLPVVAVDADLVSTAVAVSRTWQLSYWDSLIVAAAASAGCTRLLTEDLADGATYAGVRVENPFVERRRVSEAIAALEQPRGPWDDMDLAVELARYEQTCRDAGMRPNAIHSYWDYARRFLAWRAGGYRPRGSGDSGRPVPRGRVTADELSRQAAAYVRVLEAAGLTPVTVDTYHRHAMFFVRWLRGEFRPGDRLR